MIQIPQQDTTTQQVNHGFTIVELLVVIVIIGILAAITIVAYIGISQKAITSSLQSDLTNTATKLKAYQALYGSYPTALDGSNCPTAPTVDSNYCLKASSSATYTYNSVVPSTFHLIDTNGNNSYSITDTTAPAIATTANGSTVGSACPSGFIPVPGSGTYGTNDFCVMKYGAKNVGGVATSQATLTPWVSISQTTAITTSTAACSGCHLITEGEYLTIVQNALTVPSNWSTGTVGTGYIYSGHNDGAPNNALAADTNDSNGYAGETNTGGNQRRTLTLSNGQVIWDLAGNVWEWTSGTVQSPTVQPGVTGGGLNWREWTDVTNPGTISPNPSASATGIAGASSWNNCSCNGIGQVSSNADETGLSSFIRGGAWSYGGRAGVLTLSLDNAPSDTYTFLGFRVSR